MAELLVVSQDRPVPDSAGKWREGEVVMVRPDGWSWGREELNKDKFIVVELPGVSEGDVADWLEEDADEDDIIIGPAQHPHSLHRRRFVVHPALMNQGKAGGDNRAVSSHGALNAQRKDRRDRRARGLDNRPPWPPSGGAV